MSRHDSLGSDNYLTFRNLTHLVQIYTIVDTLAVRASISLRRV